MQPFNFNSTNVKHLRRNRKTIKRRLLLAAKRAQGGARLNDDQMRIINDVMADWNAPQTAPTVAEAALVDEAQVSASWQELATTMA